VLEEQEDVNPNDEATVHTHLDKAVGFQLNQLSRNFVHVLQKHGQILII
jgi:hypothetical protein